MPSRWTKRVRAHVDQVEANPFNPRQYFDDIEGMADSIREYGIQQEPTSREKPGEPGVYQLADGERRVRGVRLLVAQGRSDGYFDIKVGDISDREMIELALDSDFTKQSFSVIERAGAFANLEKLGVTQASIGAKYNLSQPAVSNLIRLLKLPELVKTAIRKNQLTAGHGSALLVLPTGTEQEAFAHIAVSEQRSVNSLATEIRAYMDVKRAESAPALPELEEAGPTTQPEAAPEPEEAAPAASSEAPQSEELEEDNTAKPEQHGEADTTTPEPEPEAVEAAEPEAAPEATPKVAPESSEKGEEIPVCRECGERQDDIESAGAHMTKIDLCSDCDPEAKAARDAVETSEPQAEVAQTEKIDDEKPEASSSSSAKSGGSGGSSGGSGGTSSKSAPAKSEPAKNAPPAAPVAPPVPEGFTRALVPTDDYFFCEDNGLTMQSAFAVLRRVHLLGVAVGLSADGLCDNISDVLQTARDRGVTEEQIRQGFFTFKCPTNTPTSTDEGGEPQ